MTSCDEAVGDDLAVVQDGDAVGEREGDVHVVLDHQQRDGGIELLEERRHGVGLRRREARGGLVEQQELGRAGQGQGDLELALLAVGEVAHHLGLLVGEAHGLEHGARPLEERRDSDRARGAGGT